jgi:hypothetical protein
MESGVPSKTMSQIYRVGVPGRDRFRSSEGLARCVVIVEIPDRVISAAA